MFAVVVAGKPRFFAIDPKMSGKAGEFPAETPDRTVVAFGVGVNSSPGRSQVI